MSYRMAPIPMTLSDLEGIGANLAGTLGAERRGGSKRLGWERGMGVRGGRTPPTEEGTWGKVLASSQKKNEFLA